MRGKQIDHLLVRHAPDGGQGLIGGADITVEHHHAFISDNKGGVASAHGGHGVDVLRHLNHFHLGLGTERHGINTHPQNEGAGTQCRFYQVDCHRFSPLLFGGSTQEGRSYLFLPVS